ncbi:MAG: hypothetical protein JWQ48_1029, partial [Conexibacter sp.]|nr:hypothetical protein [Conexibacter sp.]
MERIDVAPRGLLAAVLVVVLSSAGAAAVTTGSAAAFTARGSVRQVDVTGARAGTSLTLVDRRG